MVNEPIPKKNHHRQHKKNWRPNEHPRDYYLKYFLKRNGKFLNNDLDNYNLSRYPHWKRCH